MTMTDSPPATDTAPAVASPAVAGLYDSLTTTDHRAIGRVWLRGALLLLLGAVVVGVLLGIERMDDAAVDVFGGENAYFQMWALYRLGLALLVVAPLFVGLATVVVPQQVGSTNIAFPRAALAAAWGYLVGAGITVISVLAAGGWGALDRATTDERDAVALTLVGTGMVIISILIGAICVATTVVSLRTRGMSLARVPLFAWSMLVAASVWLLTLPVLAADLLVSYLDLHGGPGTFGGALDGDVSMFWRLEWVVEQPQVYAFAIPVLGVLGSVVPVMAGRRAERHGLSMALIGLFGVLSVGAWSQPVFQNGAVVPHNEKAVFVIFAFAAALPVLASLGGAADTLRRGNPAAGLPPAPLILSLGAGLVLLAGVGGGIAQAVDGFDLANRISITGVMNLTLFAAVTAAVAGMWFWSSKIGGHALSPMLGRLVALDLVGGALLLGIAQVANGFFLTEIDPLVPARENAADALFVVSLIGAVLVALGVAGVVAAVAQAMRGGEDPGDDPWGGHTLEWSTVGHRFAEPPAPVTSEAPLLDAASTGDEGEES